MGPLALTVFFARKDASPWV